MAIRSIRRHTPSLGYFLSTISEEATPKEKRFAQAQEALWKDVERAVGALISLWGLHGEP